MGAGPDPYGGSAYGVPSNPYGQSGYGHPGMMGGPPHMHGGGYGGSMGGGMGGSSGRGGIVPFRAGDWKCGSEGCGYHNFAKNVSCLRCGASRAGAAVVAEGGMSGFPPGGSFGGPPSHMGSMESNSYGGMTPGSSGFGGSGMGGPPGGFSGQSYGPPSTFALPSGIGAPSPYMPGNYSQMSGGQSQGGGFDSRAEQAFNQGTSSSSGAGYSNGQYGGSGYGTEGGQDPFSFLSNNMSNLGLGDGESRRNGQGAKSPQ